jgi:hypothetical protein
MGEAVRTMASPAATWAIVVVATCLALFMALAAMFTDLSVARQQRRERRLGIAPLGGEALDEYRTDTWPRLSQALLSAAGVERSAAAEIRTGAPAVDAAGRHHVPAQRQAPAEQPTPAQEPTTAQYAGAPEAEAPTQPIPAQPIPAQPSPAERAPAGRGMQDAQDARGAGRHERADESAGDMPTRPDLLAQEAPGRHAVPLPSQRTGESDRAERSFAGPAPQDDEDEGEQ